MKRPGSPRGAATPRRLSILAALFACGAIAPAHAAMTESDARQLAQLSLEDLMQVEVTTVAGVGQTRLSAPAALTVITAEDIRRAGHRSLAEAMRMVPGMYVGQVNSSSWLVGSRGLTASALTANRYLVLIDGRVAYDPLLSSTFWDVLDVVVEDIERIEVIRGPGATLWGANAMNGVISVITRDARDTLGTVARVGAGNYDRGFATLRHGGELASGAYRIWAKYAARDAFENAAGASIEDQWSSLHGGFRVDQNVRDDLRITTQGEVYTHPTAHFRIQEPIPGQHLQTRVVEGHDQVSGGHVMLRAQRDQGAGRGWSAHAYLDHSERDNVRLGLKRDTYDLDFRRWTRWGAGRHEWIWGLQYGQTEDDIAPSATFLFERPSRSVESVNAFVQNTTEVIDDRLHLMLGTKLTHHEFVGLHAQPSARLWWTPDERQTLWAAVSRPVRVPSRLEEDGAVVFSYVDTGLATGGAASGIVVPLTLAGDDALPVEKLLSWELGHRIQFGPRWTLDSSVFYNDYDRLISVPVGIFGNFTDQGSGATWGGDLVASFRASDRWRVDGSWSWLRTRIDGPVFAFEETSSPRQMAQLRSRFDISDTWEFNAALYHVGRIERTSIDAYERLDLGLTWRTSPRLELALWGQNLLDGAHAEVSGAQVPRSVYLQLTYRVR